MPGTTPTIPGVRVPPQYAEGLRLEVARLLHRHSTSFPGAQPVSFLSRHIVENLEADDYFVCEKSDGIRCLMYLSRENDAEATYLIDRKNDFYYVQGMHFPLVEDVSRYHVDCLVDGELVLDDMGNGKTIMRYLVFDSLVIDGKLLTERTLDKRLGYFRELVYKPYEALCKSFPQEVEYFPFLIDFKDMQFSYALPKLWNEIIPNLKHGSDGLIFTSRTTPYIFGTDEKILKWKPAEENSIDFRLKLHFPIYTNPDDESDTYIDYDAQPATILSVMIDRNTFKPFGELYLEPEEWEKLKAVNEPLDERVVECVMDKEKNMWRYLRFRDDKPSPNHVSVAEKVVESVKDGVTKEELLDAHLKIREAWKRRIKQQEELHRARERDRERRVNDGLNTGNHERPGEKRKLTE
ncbi:mRNA capping enzyme, catalytic domain-containing protein [Lipomyces arxii]|uniref:mRNA capping enzyme, catalytic domain-containing protein n=1 Tax=Lipomyces arxii TaxID=56418 RepID=UPI0034D01493